LGESGADHQGNHRASAEAGHDHPGESSYRKHGRPSRRSLPANALLPPAFRQACAASAWPRTAAR
jgi:hypothetical protein